MSRKAFLVQVELDIQAITCPGVWLCSNGQVSLQLYMLDSCIQTTSRKPVFPILCHEKFVFYKTYYTKHRLIDLQRQMGREWLYVELIQWQSCELGNVLASFQTTLDELLFPSTTGGSISGADVDLLMEPTKAFPGTIAPKIEISTKTTIEETICNCNRPSSSTVVVNPKTLMSSQTSHPRKIRRVCHSVAYSRAKRSKSRETRKPPFQYRKAEDDLILRRVTCEPEHVPCKCQSFKLPSKPSCTRWAEQMIKKRIKAKCENSQSARSMQCPCSLKLCNCGSGHTENACPICEKYKGYFNVSVVPCSTNSQSKGGCGHHHPRSSLYTNAVCVPRYVYNGTHCKCETPLGEKDKKEADQGCECTPDMDVGCDTRKICLCDGEARQSLAEKIHQRLAKTLTCVPNYFQSDTSNVCGCTQENYEREDTKAKANGDNDSNNNISACPICNS